MGPQLRSTRGLLDPRHVYRPSRAGQVKGQDPHSQPCFGPWKPRLFSVAKLVIYAASVHLKLSEFFKNLTAFLCLQFMGSQRVRQD